MGKPLRVLLVEDSEADARIILHQLKTDGYNPEYERVETAEAMRNALRDKLWDVILCDYRLPQFDGRAAIALLKETGMDIPIIIVSGAIGEETAVGAMRAGAHDYIMKDKMARLVPAIERELMEAKSRSKRRQAEQTLREDEDRFRRVSSMISDVVYSCSMKEDGLFSIDWMEGGAERISGYSIEEIKARQCWRFLVIEEDLALFDTNVTGLSPGSHALCELRVQRKSGAIAWVESYAECVRMEMPEGFILYGAWVDITERKQTENTLRQSEERFRTVMKNRSIILAHIDQDLRYTWIYNAHPAFKEGAVLGKRDDEIAVNEGTHQLVQLKRKSIETGSSARMEITFPLPEGETTYDILIEPIRDKKGEVIGATTAAFDVTERKQAEASIRNAERQWHATFDAMNDAVCLLDLEGRIRRCNRAMSALTGRPVEELMNTTCYSVLHGTTAPPPDCPIQRMIQSRHSEELALRLDDRWLNVRVDPLFDAEGRIAGAVHIIADITEKKRAEISLQQAEKEYRSIFEGAQEGIYRSAPEGRIVMANPAMARILGYDSPHEMMTVINDLASQIYVNPEERAKAIKNIEENDFLTGLETQFYRKDGTVVWCSRSMRAIRDAKGKTLYYEGIVEDITERKQNTERLRRALRGTVQAVAVMVETRDPYTAGHQRRVSDLARSIATRMSLSHDQIDGLRTASTIHDIGKISVPAEILSMPRKLTPIEFNLIKTHPQAGFDILKDIEFPWPIARMILEHHERMDGSGYPYGLTGENLLMESRILTVADVVEAIASHRPYRPALGINAALEEITKNKGIHYDPDVVDACLDIFNEQGYKIID